MTSAPQTGIRPPPTAQLLAATDNKDHSDTKPTISNDLWAASFVATCGSGGGGGHQHTRHKNQRDVAGNKSARKFQKLSQLLACLGTHFDRLCCQPTDNMWPQSVSKELQHCVMPLEVSEQRPIVCVSQRVPQQKLSNVSPGICRQRSLGLTAQSHVPPASSPEAESQAHSVDGTTPVLVSLS